MVVGRNNGGAAMSANLPVPLQVQLTKEDGPGRLVVELAPFVKFDHEMNLRLKQLVDRWSHLAAPRATRGSRQVFQQS